MAPTYWREKALVEGQGLTVDSDIIGCGQCIEMVNNGYEFQRVKVTPTPVIFICRGASYLIYQTADLNLTVYRSSNYKRVLIPFSERVRKITYDYWLQDTLPDNSFYVLTERGRLFMLDANGYNIRELNAVDSITDILCEYSSVICDRISIIGLKRDGTLNKYITIPKSARTVQIISNKVVALYFGSRVALAITTQAESYDILRNSPLTNTNIQKSFSYSIDVDFTVPHYSPYRAICSEVGASQRIVWLSENSGTVLDSRKRLWYCTENGKLEEIVDPVQCASRHSYRLYHPLTYITAISNKTGPMLDVKWNHLS